MYDTHTGYTRDTKQVQTANKAQLIALRTLAIQSGWSNVAAAADNLIDCLEQQAQKILADAEIAEEQAQEREWKDEMNTRESVRPF